MQCKILGEEGLNLYELVTWEICIEKVKWREMYNTITMRFHIDWRGE